MPGKLRPQSEINQDYTNYALQYGDKLFKIELLEKEASDLKSKMWNLSTEKAAPPLEAPVQEGSQS